MGCKGVTWMRPPSARCLHLETRVLRVPGSRFLKRIRFEPESKPGRGRPDPRYGALSYYRRKALGNTQRALACDSVTAEPNRVCLLASYATLSCSPWRHRG